MRKLCFIQIMFFSLMSLGCYDSTETKRKSKRYEWEALIDDAWYNKAIVYKFTNENVKRKIYVVGTYEKKHKDKELLHIFDGQVLDVVMVNNKTDYCMKFYASHLEYNENTGKSSYKTSRQQFSYGKAAYEMLKKYNLTPDSK